MKFKGWLFLSAVWGCGIVAVVACGDTSGDIAATDGGVEGSTLPPSPTSPTPPQGDGAVPDDAGDDGGELVTDGGANIDPDAGGGDDGGADGGPCNTVANDAPAISSTCSSTIPGFGGGALVAGKYHLTVVSDLGSIAFCKNTFVPTGFKETMELEVGPDGVGTANTITQLGSGSPRSATTRLDPKPPPAITLTVANICPATASVAANVDYSSGNRGGKQVLRLRLPYGRGEAVYDFEKQ